LTPVAGKGSKSKAVVSRWVTARADKGALQGVHEWSVELTAANRSHFAVGVVLGPTVYAFDKLAGPCLKISSKTPKATVVAGSALRLDGASGMVSPPPATNTAFGAVAASVAAGTTTISTNPVGRSMTSSPEHTADASPRTPPPSTDQDAAKEQTPEIPFSRTYRYPPDALALAWHSDGSLWCSGVRVASDFGNKFLPLTKGSIVSVRVDRTARTVGYYVNGEFVGVAFGPEGSGAVHTVKLPKPIDGREVDDMITVLANTVFPAASVSSSTQALRIRPSGFNGSTVVPLVLSMQKAVVSLVGRLSAVLVAGPEISASEVSSMPWFASNLMIGGVEEAASDNRGSSDGDELTAQALLDMLRDATPEQPSSSHVDALLTWFDSVDPEPAFLRQALERSNTYRFTLVERPFIACLLKHSGLVEEALDVVRSCESGGTPEPSPDLVKLW
jgi:hypothetical protein